MKSARKNNNDVLFRVERRVVIGEVIDGHGNQPPVTAGLSIIAQELEVALDRARVHAADEYATNGETSDPTMYDTLAFTWGGHTYTVHVEPSEG